MNSVSIERIPFLNVSGFLIYTSDAAILIDTGHSKTVEHFSEAMAKLGKSPSDISLIVLTHTHFDHAGGARAIKDLTAAPLAVHREEADNLRRGRTPFPKGTRWKGKLIVFIGNIFARKMATYAALDPDIILKDSLDLKPYGIPGMVLYTPGHTSGSVSVILETGDAFVGDNLMGISLKEHYPPFANDRALVLASWEKYISLGVKRLYPAHGKMVSIEALKNELENARRKYL